MIARAFPLRRSLRPVALLVALGVAAAGCSVRKLALNQMAAALAGSGGVFASDPDPELVADALPFSLKLMESVLAENPRHVGLLTGLASGFTQYAYAFLQQKADLLADDDLDGARHLESRARGLYLRARDYALRGLDQSHPGFSKALASAPRDAVLSLRAEDVPLAYWAAASWGAAISVAKDDPLLVGDLAKVEALIDRALDLDKDWGDGAIHGFLIVFEMARATAQGDPVERATRHFERAVELSGGRLASPFVSYAESVCVPTEDRERFVALLERALAVDVNAAPASRVENVVFQRRAEWLLGRVDELFLPPMEPEP